MSERAQDSYSGGCQCGAVRFAVERFGRASICHCRMCQKAFGSIGGLLVTVHGLMWTRGAPKIFQSSNLAQRGFCGDCGTPLTFAYEGGIDVAMCVLDDPGVVPPTVQLAGESRIPWADSLPDLPGRPVSEAAVAVRRYAAVVSYQHPDHDTGHWPPKAETP